MRISRIQIQNFRNFASLDIPLAGNAVIVGENKIGKTNLLYALRLVLDPSLPDSARQLRREDFWDGLPRPLRRTDKIAISIDITDFDADVNHMALLAEHVVDPESMTARLTYVFQPLETLDGGPTKDADYEYVVYGGQQPQRRLPSDVRRGLPVDLLPALRDAEGDLANWRRSPLRPLVDTVAGRIDSAELETLAGGITGATQAVAAHPEVQALVEAINARVQTMVGPDHAVQTTLGFSSTDPDRLLRTLRMFIDAGQRDIGAASLGSANVLYLTLKALELDQAVAEGRRYHTFLAIEEPEAHLHPHLQRLVYRDFLRAPAAGELARPSTVFLTTHSPHIVSVAPLKSIVLLRRSTDSKSSEGVSTANLDLDPRVVNDLERYLDVTRGEMLFAKAVIFVEGDTERFLLPALAKARGIHFDELGISVSSIAGTNFAPYIALMGERGLRLPVAIVTDGDRDDQGASAGEKRVLEILASLVPPEELAGKPREAQLAMAEAHGLFVGTATCELDLFSAGAHAEICDTMIELAPNPTARNRAERWQANPATLDSARFLKDVKVISKGRFAQRLAGRLGADHCPSYISKAIEYVRARAR